MRVRLLDIEKVRILINKKLQTRVPSLLSELADNVIENIKKIYASNKWINDFEIVKENSEYFVKYWTANEIKYNLETNITWLYRGLLAIYNKQTLDEQYIEEVSERNNVGFTGVDAYFLTQMAKTLEKRGTLSEKQTLVTRKKMLKYSIQLLKIAQKKI